MKKLSVLFLFTFISCTSLDYNIPTYRMDSPEVSGGFANMDAAITVGGGYDVNLATAYDFIISGTITEESINGPEPISSLKYNFGLMDKLDIGIQFFPDTTDLLKIKYQFIGGDRTKPGLKLSAQAELGIGYSENGTLTTSSTSYTTDLDVNSYGISLNIGHRYNPNVLVYLNTVFTEYSVKGVLKDGATVSYDGEESPEVLLILPGVRFDFTSTYIQLETGYSVLNTGYTRKDNNELSYGLSFGYTL